MAVGELRDEPGSNGSPKGYETNTQAQPRKDYESLTRSDTRVHGGFRVMRAAEKWPGRRFKRAKVG